MSEFCLVYVTAQTLEEAQAIGRAVVEKRLAACANILPGMKSIYLWKGELHEDDEVVLICKTTASRVDELTAAIVSLHSYECPCVAVMPIAPGNAAYFEWLAEAVA